MQAYAAAIQRNLDWFKNSGVMRPGDGFWGMAERVAVIPEGEALDLVNSSFPCQTALGDDVRIIEHRRADCTLEAWHLFDRAAAHFDDADLQTIADNLLGYCMNRSCLCDGGENSPTKGMWGWAAPSHMDKYWLDDNAWVATLLLKLGGKRPELREKGLVVARQLYDHSRPYLDHHLAKGHGVRFPGLATTPVLGLKLNPHWIGLVTMALAHAAAVDDSRPYARFVQDYHSLVFKGPTVGETRYLPPEGSDLAWPVSEYGYLALTASIASQQFGGSQNEEAACRAADILISEQQEDGHFRSETNESPRGAHLADLVYTDNWAVLGLYHAWKVFGDKKYQQAFERSLAFLAAIQDTSADPRFNGCWRGLYDTDAGAWGGGDHYEGGAGSIYTGWTNAPIAWALLFSLTGEDLFAETHSAAMDRKGRGEALPALSASKTS